MSAQVCGKCGSDGLGWRFLSADYGRKECRQCGSTGPFGPPENFVSAMPQYRSAVPSASAEPGGQP